MGTAIANGGITTFLALILLGFSQSHAFIVFFKVFLLTVVFGLFHGLVFLPVLLSIAGSDSEAKEKEEGDSEESPSELTGSSSSTHGGDDDKKEAGEGKGVANAGYQIESSEEDDQVARL